MNEMEGSDLDQMISMLEKAEIDHVVDDEGGEEVMIYVNDKVQVTFDEDGNLLSMNIIMN